MWPDPMSATVCSMAERRDQVDAGRLEPLTVRWVAVGPFEPPTPGDEDVGRLDDIALDPSRDGDDLADAAMPGRVRAEMHDEVDAGRHGRHDEGGRIRLFVPLHANDLGVSPL